MKRALAATLIAAALAGCGGGSTSTSPPTTAPPSSDFPPPSSDLRPPTSVPTATTNTPPTQHRTTPQPLSGSPSTQPLRVGSGYSCGGKRLKTIDARGPVKVRPAVVKPGESFTVAITDPGVKVALVSLAGVSPKPIQEPAKEQGGRLAATLRMPRSASCGNKLLEIEGDLSAEAYVGVSG